MFFVTFILFLSFVCISRADLLTSEFLAERTTRIVPAGADGPSIAPLFDDCLSDTSACGVLVPFLSTDAVLQLRVSFDEPVKWKQVAFYSANNVNDSGCVLESVWVDFFNTTTPTIPSSAWALSTAILDHQSSGQVGSCIFVNELLYVEFNRIATTTTPLPTLATTTAQKTTLPVSATVTKMQPATTAATTLPGLSVITTAANAPLFTGTFAQSTEGDVVSSSSSESSVSVSNGALMATSTEARVTTQRQSPQSEPIMDVTTAGGGNASEDPTLVIVVIVVAICIVCLMTLVVLVFIRIASRRKRRASVDKQAAMLGMNTIYGGGRDADDAMYARHSHRRSAAGSHRSKRQSVATGAMPARALPQRSAGYQAAPRTYQSPPHSTGYQVAPHSGAYQAAPSPLNTYAEMTVTSSAAHYVPLGSRSRHASRPVSRSSSRSQLSRQYPRAHQFQESSSSNYGHVAPSVAIQYSTLS